MNFIQKTILRLTCTLRRFTALRNANTMLCLKVENLQKNIEEHKRNEKLLYEDNHELRKTLSKANESFELERKRLQEEILTLRSRLSERKPEASPEGVPVSVLFPGITHHDAESDN